MTKQECNKSITLLTATATILAIVSLATTGVHAQGVIETETGVEGSAEITNDANGEITERATAQTHISVKINGNTTVFRDVPRNEWFATHVGALAEAKIISGYKDARGNLTGEFGPDDNVTAEQMIKIGVEAANIDTSGCENPSVNSSAWSRWSERYVACAEDFDWNVYGEAKTDVRLPATRAEVAAVLVNAFDIAPKRVQGDVFTDVSASTEYASAIETLVASGIVEGYVDAQGNATGNFGPNDEVNRAEAAKMTHLTIMAFTQE